jgi:ATP-binding cassette subfamily B protein
MRNKLKSFPVERQMDVKDCGPACLKMIAKFYGKFYSLQYLRDKCGLSREGVSLLSLSYGADAIGLRTISIKASVIDLYQKIPLPCIVHWNRSHYIVVYKVTASKVYVSDPSKGHISYTHDEFKKSWYGEDGDDGVLLVLEPRNDFSQIEAGEKLARNKTFGSILMYFYPYRKNFLTLFMVMLIVTGLEALLPFISKAVIDIGIQTHDLTFINIVLIANIVIVISVTLSNAVRDWILMHITARVNIALISDYLMKLMKLPISFYQTKTTGDILQRANDLERIRTFIMHNSLNFIFSTLTFIVFGIILLIYNTFVFYTFLAGSIFYVLWIFVFFSVRKKIDWEYFELISKNQSYWVETIESMSDIKINNYEQSKRWKWENIQARLYKVNTRSLSINNFQNLGAQTIDSIKNLMIIFFCAKAVISGDMTFGAMISTQFILGLLNGPLNQLIVFVITAQLAHISFLRLSEIHQMKDEEEIIANNNVALPENKSVSFNDVSFQYTEYSEIILKRLTFSIPEGKVTAIVGDSGSGKSTILKLLLRLYLPSYGNITVGGMNLNNIDLKQWREKCGAVMQDGKIFNDTIINNIVLGKEEIDYSRLKYAVETANISNEIGQLPLGYQTLMGEMGRTLSGGQQQRLLIARALYKDPDYLIFDEATNSLDSINEQKIISALENVFKNKTVIVVAHRLSTIKSADQIIVMKDGVIAEIGNHAELMVKRGRYFQLVQAQINITATLEAEFKN